MKKDQEIGHAATLPVADIIERLCQCYNASSEADLARMLSLPQSTLASWKARGSIPLNVLLLHAAKLDISLDWLVFGARGAEASRPGQDRELDLEALGLALKTGLPQRALKENEFQVVANGIARLYLNFRTILYSLQDKNNISRGEALDIVRKTAQQFGHEFFGRKSSDAD